MSGAAAQGGKYPKAGNVGGAVIDLGQDIYENPTGTSNMPKIVSHTIGLSEHITCTE